MYRAVLALLGAPASNEAHLAALLPQLFCVAALPFEARLLRECLSSCCDSCLVGQITNVHACVGAGCSLFSGKACVPAGVPWVLFRAANACKSPSAARIAAK